MIRVLVFGVVALAWTACFPDPPECGESKACPASQDPCIEVACVARICVESPIESAACGDEDISGSDVVDAETHGDTGVADVDVDDGEIDIDTSNDGDSVTNETDIDGGDVEAIEEAEVETSIDIDEVEAMDECDEARPCTAANACEKARCESGSCVFEAVVCVATDACHKAGVCEPATGLCTNPTQINGTPCDDGERCTASDACAGGVCGGTRAPDDETRGDFSNIVLASHGARAAGLTSSATEVYLAVAFPLETVVEGPVTVDFGMTATQTPIILTLPETANHGLAIARYSLTGQLREAKLVATSTNPITDTAITWLANDTLYVSGTFETRVRLFNDLAWQEDVTTTVESKGLFGFNFHDVTPNPVVVEQELPYEIPPRLLSRANDCAILMNVAQERSVTIYNGAGQALDHVENEGSATTEVWVTWLPQCLPLTVDARRVAGGQGNAAIAFFGDLTDSGTLVVGIGADGGVSYGDAAELDPVVTFTGLRSVIVGIARDRVTFVSRIEDSLADGINGLPIAHGVSASGEEAYVGVNLTGQAQIITAGETTQLIGNPVSPAQPAQRIVLMKLGADGKVAWMHAYPEDKEPIFMFMAAGPDDVAVATPWNGTFLFETSIPPVVGDNLVISTWDADGGRWAAPLLNQVGGQEAAIPDDTRATPPHLVRVPQTAGLFVAGTIVGRGKLGIAEQIERGEPDQSSAFLSRVNSENGVGCPAP